MSISLTRVWITAALPSGFSARSEDTGQGVVLFIKGGFGIGRLVLPPSSALSVRHGRVHLGVSAHLSGGLLACSQRVHYRLHRCFTTLSGFAVSGFRLVGRGYRVAAVASRRCLVLELGWSGKRAVPLPLNVNLRILTRYTFELHSLDKGALRSLSRRVRQLRPPNAYTQKGIFMDAESVKPKQGKASQY